MNHESNNDNLINTHQLCIVQSHSLFLDHKDRVINTVIDINNDDAKRYGLSPLIVVIMAIQGVGIYDARMFSSTRPIDIGRFIHDVWFYNYNFRGVPDKICIDPELDATLDFQSVISIVTGVHSNVEIDTSGGRSFSAVKRKAKELAKSRCMKDSDFSPESIFRDFELLGESGYSPSAFKDIDTNNGLDVVNLALKWQMMSGIYSNSIRYDRKRPGADIQKIKAQSDIKSNLIKRSRATFLIDHAEWMSIESISIPDLKEYQRLEIGLGDKFSRADVTSGQYVSRWLEPHNEEIPEEFETSWVGYGLGEALRCLVGNYSDHLINTHLELAQFIAGRGSLPILTWRKIYWDIMNRDCAFEVKKPTDLKSILRLFDAKECQATYLIYNHSSGARESSYMALMFVSGLKVFSISPKCLTSIVTGNLKSLLNNVVQIDCPEISKFHSAFDDHSNNIYDGKIFYDFKLLLCNR